jgi:hypothetical protein
MQDKTSVKSSVSESDKNLNQTPSDEGKIPSEVEIEKRVRENLRAEYERKAEVNQERLNEALDRLEQLEEKDRLTASERAEKNKLENKIEGLEDGLYKLDHDPQYAVMAEKFRRTKNEAVAQATESVKKEVMYEFSKVVAARDIKAQAKEEGLTVKQLESEIEEILKSDDHYFKRMLPHERAEKALEIRGREKTYTTRLKDLEKRSKSDEFSESSNTTPPAVKSTSELIKSGDFDSVLKRL